MQAILCEIGTDVFRFRNASAFASWLGLCPEKKISGGKVLFTTSRRVRCRVATALRMGASFTSLKKRHSSRRISASQTSCPNKDFKFYQQRTDDVP
jgi:transposase